MICIRCASMNIENIERVAERSGKPRLSLNRLGQWYKCHECGCTFLWDEHKPEWQPGVYVDMMERDEEDATD